MKEQVSKRTERRKNGRVMEVKERKEIFRGWKIKSDYWTKKVFKILRKYSQDSLDRGVQKELREEVITKSGNSRYKNKVEMEEKCKQEQGERGESITWSWIYFFLFHGVNFSFNIKEGKERVYD